MFYANVYRNKNDVGQSDGFQGFSCIDMYPQAVPSSKKKKRVSAQVVNRTSSWQPAGQRI